ncbi:malonyl-ACP O-methyltransferase BioC [Phytohalomonas tamaricis]|uniref:malonyl-ACP O-methyltransferase BioC n=1 Tax=Phytohalomonas tamaricis TaxID=2081032 RepID=UPI000D0B8851|nr:malonyl-ACP O-methyltransferase BioC [Phytohalomonas tamaricis]
MNGIISVDKRRVAASFSRAATTYDDAAHLQRTIGHALMERLPVGLAPARVLDVGCGTGYFTRQLAERFPGAAMLGLDLAHGMLTHARQHTSEATTWLQGDAERLPLAAESMGLVFSSLAVQWCAGLDVFLAEAARVLRPGGWLAFTTLGDGTLHELKALWQDIDPFVHVNEFLSRETIEASVACSSLTPVMHQYQRHVIHHATPEAMMRELKAIGAHNINAGRTPGLTGRQRLMCLRKGYEPLRTPAGLPTTYHACYLLLKKPLKPSP